MSKGDDPATRFRDPDEARKLAQEYAADARVTVRGLADRHGHSYGYVHRRVRALTTMRGKGRRVSDGDGE